jgi:CCR4-NOT transcription complex subunit 1
MLRTRLVLSVTHAYINTDISALIQRKLNIPVTVTLLRSGLVNTSLQDQQLAKSLFQDPRPTLQSFAAGLVRECLSSDPPVASQSQLTYTVEVLGQLSQAGKANEEYVFTLRDFDVLG